LQAAEVNGRCVVPRREVRSSHLHLGSYRARQTADDLNRFGLRKLPPAARCQVCSAARARCVGLGCAAKIRSSWEPWEGSQTLPRWSAAGKAGGLRRGRGTIPLSTHVGGRFARSSPSTPTDGETGLARAALKSRCLCARCARRFARLPAQPQPCSIRAHARSHCAFRHTCACGFVAAWLRTPRAGWRSWRRRARAR
jgi:hypothetical protein